MTYTGGHRERSIPLPLNGDSPRTRGSQVSRIRTCRVGGPRPHASLVLVVEPAPVVDLPPAVHLALSVDYDTAGQTLVENGWRPRSWLPRQLGKDREGRRRARRRCSVTARETAAAEQVDEQLDAVLDDLDALVDELRGAAQRLCEGLTRVA
jgi:hypothetical protein